MLFFCNYCYKKLLLQLSRMNQYMVINVDFTSNFVQHPAFRNGEKYKAKISNKEIFFDVDGELSIDRKLESFQEKILKWKFIKM